ncbi:MAG: GGDEF domain-containing protein [Firmicutes bacterium]|nr:GGDEF domain-containing protein [Bacillota bacterium]
MEWQWTSEDDALWKASRPGLDRLYATWTDLAAQSFEHEPAFAHFSQDHEDPNWFRQHLELHREAFLGSPLDPTVRESSRHIGFSHIESRVPPSQFVSLYMHLFAAYGTVAQETALPPIALVSRRWLMDVEMELDTYTVAMDTKIRALDDLSATDPLTGLLNRHGLVNHISDHIHRDDAWAAFVLMDLDNFKAINDEKGHPEGDRILQQFAIQARAHTQASDGVARLGGDEFVWWVPGLTDIRPVHQRLASLAKSLSRELGLSFSAGVAYYPEHGQDIETLYAQADQALYRAKSAGRVRWALANRNEVYLFRYNVLKHIYTDPCRNLLDLHIPEHV